MDDIVLIEPLASRGGHMMGNVGYFRKQLRAEGASPEFVVERDLAVPDQADLYQILTPAEELSTLGEEERISRRMEEYRRLGRRDGAHTFIFLTNFDFDWPVWHRLIADDDWRQDIRRHGHVLVIHATSLTPCLLDLLQRCRRWLEELGRNLFLSFYSELQAALVQKEAGYANCLTLPRPVNEELSLCRRPATMREEYISYLGFYTWAKNPHLMLPLLRAGLPAPVHIQFYPLSDANVLWFGALQEQKRTEDVIHARPLQDTEYAEAIFRTRVGLLPYHPSHYAVQASGLLEEYMLAGVPVVVPRDTWLEHTLHRHEGGGLAFDVHQEGDFLGTTEKLCRAYNEHKERAVEAAERLGRRNGTHAFLDILRELGETRTCPDLSREAWSEGVAVRKGRAHLWSLQAESCPDSVRAEALLRRACADDPDNGSARFLLARLLAPPGRFDVPAAIREVARSAPLSLNPHQCIERLEQGQRCGDDEYDREVSAVIAEFSWDALLSLESAARFLSRFRTEVEIRRLFGPLIERQGQCVESGMEAALYEAVGGRLRSAPGDLWREFFRAYAERLSGQGDRTSVESYRMASALQAIGGTRAAREGFRELLAVADDPKLLSGVYFHLGQLAEMDGEYEEAFTLFGRCLEHGQDHTAAREGRARVAMRTGTGEAK